MGGDDREVESHDYFFAAGRSLRPRVFPATAEANERCRHASGRTAGVRRGGRTACVRATVAAPWCSPSGWNAYAIVQPPEPWTRSSPLAGALGQTMPPPTPATEWQRAGVEVLFLNRAIGKSPEEDLSCRYRALNTSEIPRTESSRQACHAARAGSVNVLCGGPTATTFMSANKAAGRACYEIKKNTPEWSRG